MRNGWKLLAVVVLACAMAQPGCQLTAMSALGAGAGAGYVNRSKDATKQLTTRFNREGSMYVEDAVKTWLDRGQLPLPALPDGMHNFSVLKGDLAAVQKARGAQVVHLYDGQRLIADYTIAWDRRPMVFRVDKAVNRLYEGELKTDAVPKIRVTDLYY